MRYIGDTTCGDTISVRSDMLNSRANDALRYTFLINAAKIPGVTKACFSIKSNDAALEQFKTSLGYESLTFPAHTQLRPGLKPALKLFFCDQYNRMIVQYINAAEYFFPGDQKARYGKFENQRQFYHNSLPGLPAYRQPSFGRVTGAGYKNAGKMRVCRQHHLRYYVGIPAYHKK